MPRGNENASRTRRNPRRQNAPTNYGDDGVAEKDDSEDEEGYGEEEENNEDDVEMEESSEEDTKRRGRRGSKKPEKSQTSSEGGRRTSSRANKFSRSMAEPSGSIKELIEGTFLINDKPKARKASRGSRQSSENDDDDVDSDSEEEITKPRSKRAKATKKQPPQASPTGRYKSPARRHAKARLQIHSASKTSSESSDASSVVSLEEEESEEEEPLKIQRILASKSETHGKWREICKSIQTTEIEYGSRWFQQPEDTDDKPNDDEYEERFLVKWKDLSFLHCSWESQADLENQIDGAKTYLTTFFRKSEDGLLFTADERCDGDYFDPAYTQIERILEVHLPEDGDFPALTYEDEDKYGPSDFGIVMDKSDPKFEDGTGRQFLIKWANLPYSEATYEFERDLILNDIDYKDELKEFLKRNAKPQKTVVREKLKVGEKQFRSLYKIFGDSSNISDKEKKVEEYKESLQKVVFKNGGQVRDYQAEGIAWMISNFVNQRSSILADEMGLGKTLQTALSVNIISSEMHRRGPVLIIAPLSTLIHWKREFNTWTDLNVIIYHGSAEDRKLIRQHEFAYECDRPEGGVAFNQLYLKKCIQKRSSVAESPWMVQVVITTPEMMVCEDSNELASIPWEVLVVDEAHRLKNNSSKLTVQLKNDKFTFKHKILLTGTPIQNDVQEFWTLLNFIDPVDFEDLDEFMEKYGNLKSKERVDQLHEEIRPYILRRLKEDVEKSVPPKEETLIEVELTVAQKQYYRALYEKNVSFLHRNNKRALDGPSLNNLAMQLRKCCNHLFLLNGVEDEFRNDFVKKGERLSEGDLLVKASGKLVLLDKLLPRLKEQGHKVLLFSQFKIMLDILEDYFESREMKFERIDGSITGHKRQQAIDRFQADEVEGRESPFIMMLSTRAGGVGINLTAADTCIIFDSDFNPQNDLQAQARCHRIGQTKQVKVYRLLSRKTYEMRLFHMSSLKMGLDQAVLKGFESGATGEGALSKAEVENLLRHGAYDIFNEEKAGTAESESNDFVQQDIDSILERRSRLVVHDNTGSKSNAAGGTFSKASFMAKSPDGTKGDKKNNEDVDIEDPEFWKKMLGEPVVEEEDDLGKRPRSSRIDYAERKIAGLEEYYAGSDSSANEESDGDDESDDAVESDEFERSRWGGSSSKKEWKKDDADAVIKAIQSYGYGVRPWEDVVRALNLSGEYDMEEVKRMFFSVVLLTFLETAEDDVAHGMKRTKKEEAKKAEEDGGVLASTPSQSNNAKKQEMMAEAFKKVWAPSRSWVGRVLQDAVDYAKNNNARDGDTIMRVLKPDLWKAKNEQKSKVSEHFAKAWQSLKNRGWKAQVITSGDQAGKTRYEFEDEQFWSHESVLKAARDRHPDLADMCDSIIALENYDRQQSGESKDREKTLDTELNASNVDADRLQAFLERYAPLQLLADRKRASRLPMKRKVISTCTFMDTARALVQRAKATSGDPASISRLAESLVVDKRSTLPHPMWTSRHDAILVFAITKHGWIDNESRLRAIAEDSGIKWGAPFEAKVEGSNGGDKEETRQHLISDELRDTANRAATFFTAHREMLEAYKGFNKNAVVVAYGLTRHTKEGSESLDFEPDGAFRPAQWFVDESALEGHSKDSGEPESGSSTEEAVDLPTPKDLQKRAKTVLGRHSNDLASASSANDSEQRNAHGFAVLDQSDRCNVLLAEIVRALSKSSPKVKDHRKLCDAAHDEAMMRLEQTRARLLEADSPGAELAAAVSEWEQIGEQLKLVKAHIVKSPRQAKNVLRVMLGEEPHQGRTTEDSQVSLFPVTKTKKSKPISVQSFTKKKMNSVKAPAPKAKVVAPVVLASGDMAIEKATRKLLNLNGIENAQPSSLSETTLQLTEVETIILLVACSEGLPFWSNDLRNSTRPVSHSTKKSSPYELTWGLFGKAVADTAERLLAEEKRELEYVKSKIASLGEAGDKSATSNLEQQLWNRERICGLKQRALSQAQDYMLEPDTLAKKTIMMMAKIVRLMGKGTGGNTLIQTSYLGPEVLNWFEGEIARWANSLDLLDNVGRPLGFTAVDFMEDLPETERSQIEVSGIMDKVGCRGVTSQAALMTRLRSIFSLGPGIKKLARMDLAEKNLEMSRETWPDRPDWWDSKNERDGLKMTARHDRLLLERLLHRGFTHVLDDSKCYGLGDIAVGRLSFKNAGITAAGVQLRAGQLTRHLHAIEESGVLTYHVVPRRSEGARMPPQSQPQPGGLASFFSNPEPPPKKTRVSDGSDEVEVVGVIPAKRKDSPEDGNDSPVSEKKLRTSSI